jgi:hypothetical protein
MAFNTTFNNISVSFIGGGNDRTGRKSPTCCKSLINSHNVVTLLLYYPCLCCYSFLRNHAVSLSGSKSVQVFLICLYTSCHWRCVLYMSWYLHVLIFRKANNVGICECHYYSNNFLSGLFKLGMKSHFPILCYISIILILLFTIQNRILHPLFHSIGILIHLYFSNKALLMWQWMKQKTNEIAFILVYCQLERIMLWHSLTVFIFNY